MWQCSINFTLHHLFMFTASVSCVMHVAINTIRAYEIVNYILIQATIVLVTKVIIIIINILKWLRGSIVVKALCYKPEGWGFETRWGEWIFSICLILPDVLGPGVYSAFNRVSTRSRKIMFLSRWTMSRIVIVILIYHRHKPIDSFNLLGS
jgi:hypothetical protein